MGSFYTTKFSSSRVDAAERSRIASRQVQESVNVKTTTQRLNYTTLPNVKVGGPTPGRWVGSVGRVGSGRPPATSRTAAAI